MRREGNAAAQAAVREVFESTLRAWRGIANIPHSGLRLTPAYADYDPAVRFRDALAPSRSVGEKDPDCQSGLVLQGLLKPPDCPAFGSRCTPEKPLGTPMVSNEGACVPFMRPCVSSGTRSATGMS